MKNKFFLFSMSILTMSEAFGASLKGTADALGKEAIQLGLGLGIFALAVAGTYLALGKQEGGQKVTQAIVGILIVLVAKTIVGTLTSVAGGA
jgi:type IV secretory pathway VirB2 component (pilin)